MKGFQITIENDIIQHNIRFDNNHFDNYFSEDDHTIICLEGVILNKNQLIHSNNLKSDYLNHLYILFDINLIKHLEGEFVGFIYDKRKKKVYSFTNFTATRKLFYYKEKNSVIIDTSLILLNKTLRKRKLPFSLDESAIYQLLVCENTLENYTPIKEVKKLNEAEILDIEVESLKMNIFSYHDSYHRFDGSKAEALKEIDNLFNKAICLEFNKDKEFNKDTFVLLSGGLDSRMTFFAALKNGFNIDEAFCFSQKNYWDEIIARKIAKDLNVSFHFIDLNGGEYISEFDEIFKISHGLINYSGALHTNFAYKSIDKNRFGLIHSGQLGDGVFGMFNKNRFKTPPTKNKIIVHNHLFPKLEKDFNSIISKYDSEEKFLTRNIGYNRAVLGSYMAEEFSYQTSPFMNSNFIKFIQSLPEDWKYNQELYIEWINKYHKNATKYIWERTLLKPKHRLNTVIGDKLVKRAYTVLLNKVLKKQYIGKMTAYNYYYQKHKIHKMKMDAHFDSSIHLVHSNELKQDLTLSYKNGSFTEKTTVLTVLSIVNNYFSE